MKGSPHLRRRRLLALGLVALGALSALAGCSTSKPSGHDATATTAAKRPARSDAAQPPATEPPARVSTRSYQPGDCVTWDQQASGAVVDERVVRCDQDHLLEIIGQADVSSYTVRPMPRQWSEIIVSECDPLTTNRLGYQLDSAGRFILDAVEPDADQWRSGDRTLWCGVATVPTTARPFPGWRQPFTGVVKGQSQDLLYPVGTCLGLGAKGSGGVSGLSGVVSCTTPHGVEITGNVDISTRVQGYPMPSDMPNVVGAECERLARSYLGKPLPPNVYGRWFDLQFSSWSAGRRTVQCTVAMYEDRDVSLTPGPLRG